MRSPSRWRESRAAIDGLKAAKPSTRRELYRRLERARGFLHDHDDRGVTLAEMASVAGLSQFHLARYFKSAFGRAPIAYHRDLRLARAADLLDSGGCSVAAAAEATGYSDQVALSHAFRRQYGAPPQTCGRAPAAEYRVIPAKAGTHEPKWRYVKRACSRLTSGANKGQSPIYGELVFKLELVMPAQAGPCRW